MKKAILFGASGFIGSYLLDELFNDPSYEQVTFVVRKDLKKQNPKLKGETERDIIALDLNHTHIFRPSLILGNRTEFRAMEKLLVKLWVGINPLLIVKLNCLEGC